MIMLQIHQIFNLLVLSLMVAMSAAKAQHRSPARVLMEQFALAYTRANTASAQLPQTTLAALNESDRTTWQGYCFQLYSPLSLPNLLKQVHQLPSPLFAAQRQHHLVITSKQGHLSPQETFQMGYEISFFNGEYQEQNQTSPLFSDFTVTKPALKLMMDLRPYPAVALTSRQPRELLIFDSTNGSKEKIIWQWRELVDFTNEVCRYQLF